MLGAHHPYSLHCSSVFGLPSSRILRYENVKPKKGATMETIGSVSSKFQAELRSQEL